MACPLVASRADTLLVGVGGVMVIPGMPLC